MADTLQGSTKFSDVIAQNPEKYASLAPDKRGDLAADYFAKVVTPQAGYSELPLKDKVGVFHDFLNKYKLPVDTIPNVMETVSPAQNPVEGLFHNAGRALTDFNTVAGSVVKPFQKSMAFGIGPTQEEFAKNQREAGADQWAINAAQNPIVNTVSDILGLGAPIQALEHGAVNLGAKILPQAIKPAEQAGASLLSKIVGSATKQAAGFGAYEGIRQPIEGLQQGNHNLNTLFQQAGQGATEGALTGAAFGAAMPVAGAALKGAVKFFQPDVRPVGLPKQPAPEYMQHQPVDRAQTLYLKHANDQRQRAYQKQLMQAYAKAMEETQAAKPKQIKENPVFQLKAKMVGNELQRLVDNIRHGITLGDIHPASISDAEIQSVAKRMKQYHEGKITPKSIASDKAYVEELKHKMLDRHERLLKAEIKANAKEAKVPEETPKTAKSAPQSLQAEIAIDENAPPKTRLQKIVQKAGFQNVSEAQKTLEHYTEIKGQVKNHLKGEKTLETTELQSKLNAYKERLNNGEKLGLTDLQGETLQGKIDKFNEYVDAGKDTPARQLTAQNMLNTIEHKERVHELKTKIDAVPSHVQEVLRTKIDTKTGIGKQNISENALTLEDIRDNLEGRNENTISLATKIDKAMQVHEAVTMDYKGQEATSALGTKEKITPLYWLESENGINFRAYNPEKHLTTYTLQNTLHGTGVQSVELTGEAGYKGPEANIYKGAGEYDIHEALNRTPRTEAMRESVAYNILDKIKEIKALDKVGKLPEDVKAIIDRIEADKAPKIKDIADLKKALDGKNLNELKEICNILGLAV
jgi:hypothetical protein